MQVGDGPEGDLPPPPPVLPPPPMPEQRAVQVADCLRKAGVDEAVIKDAIRALGKEQQIDKYEPLDAKQGHKHLQVYKKAEKKVQMLKEGIGEMERAWSSFVEQLQERFGEQKRCFLEKRVQLVEELAQAREKRDAARTQLRQLSEQLAEEGSETEAISQVSDLQLENFFASMPHPNPVEVPDSKDEAPMDEDEELVQDTKPAKTSPGARKPPRAFAPRKVQPTHLKPRKESDEKAKEQDDAL